MRQLRTQHPWSLFGLLGLGLAALIAASTAAFAAGSWTPDPAHTEISFSVNHFFTPVKGRFSEFEIDLDYDVENPENSTVEARIEVDSIDTGNERRDNHLRSADFLEAATYPVMSFKSTAVRKVGDDRLVATGTLTIKGQTQEIELPIILLGRQSIPEEMQPAFGGILEVASFKASMSIDRGDFGVGVGNWAATLVVGGTVDIEILLEAHRR